MERHWRHWILGLAGCAAGFALGRCSGPAHTKPVKSTEAPARNAVVETLQAENGRLRMDLDEARILAKLSERMIPSDPPPSAKGASDPIALKVRFEEALARGDRDAAVVAWMELNRLGKEAFPIIVELLKYLSKVGNFSNRIYRQQLCPEFCEWVLSRKRGDTDPSYSERMLAITVLRQRYPERICRVISLEMVLGEKGGVGSDPLAMLHALTSSPDPAVAGTLVKVAKGHSDEGVRAYTVGLLREWSSSDVVQALREIQASDSSPAVRAAAGKALEKK